MATEIASSAQVLRVGQTVECTPSEGSGVMEGLGNVLPLRSFDSREVLRDHGAPLPERYLRAVDALAEVDRLDECREWADRAEALRSYARQARDGQLEVMAKRIRARAMKRAGELLRKIEPDKGGRPSETKVAAGPSLTRKQAAEDAGMSERQQKTALRIANIPKHDFEAQVEAANPPSLTALAAQGKATRAAPPVEDDEDDEITGAEADEYFRKVLGWAKFGLLDPNLWTGPSLEQLRAAFARLPEAAQHEFREMGRAVAMIAGEGR